MLPSNTQLLRAQLIPALQRIFGGTTDASTANAIRTDTDKIITLVLSDILGDWNRQHNVIQLSTEVLSLCFGFLPLEDRFAVTSVSRTWRGAALAPSVWSNICIDLSMHNVLPMLDRALFLAGNCPVDFRLNFSTRYSYLELRAIERALMAHMYHLRSISWYGALQLGNYTSPAPLLRSLHVGSLDSAIPMNLFGGKAGSLCSLEIPMLILPLCCPALSSLTYLSAAINSYPAQPDMFNILFRTCPHLTKLSLRGISCQHKLPSRPAPHTLLDLALETADRSCDLVPYQRAMQRVDNLTSVRVSHMNAACRLDLAGFMRGVIDLTLRATLEEDIVDLRCRFSRGQQRRLIAHKMIMFYLQVDVCAFPPVFAQDKECFARLEKVCIPISVLPVFAHDVPTPLSSLREVCIVVRRKTVVLDQIDIRRVTRFPWDLLTGLAALNLETRDGPASAMPVQVTIDAETERLTPADAETLLSRLSEIVAARDGIRRLSFTVCGISAADACAANELADERGLQVTFHRCSE